MLNINLKERKDFNRKGLVELLQSIFSDEDTNGNNGKEHGGQVFNYFGAKKIYDVLSVVEESWSDDQLMEAYVMHLPNEMTEEEIVKTYADWYVWTYRNWCEEQSYSYTKNENGQITTIAWAFN